MKRIGTALVFVVGLAVWLAAQGPAAPSGVHVTAAHVDATGCLAANGCYPKPNTFVGAGRTGYPSGLTLNTGCTTSFSANTTYTGCDWSGVVNVNAANVTIKNSRFRNYVQSNSTNLIIEDSEVGPDTCNSGIDASVREHNYTLRRVYVHNVGDGPRCTSQSANCNILIEDTMVLTCSSPGDHSDGFQGYQGGGNVKIYHSTFDMRVATSNNAAVFFADNDGSPAGADVEDVLMIGGTYSLKVHDDNTPDEGPWIFLRNRIVSGSYQFGPSLTTNTGCPGDSGNNMTWPSTGANINRLVTIDSNYNVTALGSTVSC